MAQATNTTLGEIKLAGDLGGSNDANFPALSNTGITPGEYSFPTMTVDGKGRITAISSGSSLDVSSILSTATTSVKGVVQIGQNIDVNAGTISVKTATVTDFGLVKLGTGLTSSAGTVSVLTSELDPATSSTIGVVKTGSGIINTNGVISVDPATVAGAGPVATNSTLGTVKTGLGILNTAGVISVDQTYVNTTIPVASTTALGGVKVGSGLSITAGVLSVDAYPIASPSVSGVLKTDSATINNTSGTISIPYATSSTPGVIAGGDYVTLTGGVLSANKATASTAGVVQIGSGLSVTNGIVAFDSASLQNATTTTKGIVQVGSGFSVSSGVLSFNINDTANFATTTSKGIVQVTNGNGLSLVSGVLAKTAEPDASTSVKGIVQINNTNGLSITAGSLSINAENITKASAGAFGVARVDGTTILSTAGVLSIPTGTTTTKGVVQVTAGNGLSISAGVVSLNVPVATTSTTGTVQVGANLNINGAGVLSIPAASTSTLGVVRIGTSTSISLSGGTLNIGYGTTVTPGILKKGPGLLTGADGEIFLNTTNAACFGTSSQKGIVQVDGTSIISTAGVISVPAATTTTAGTVKIDGTTIMKNGSDQISVPNATNLLKGVVQIGTGLTATAGTVSVDSATLPAATSSVLGTVRIGNGLSIDGSGIVSLTNPTTYAYTNAANTWTQVQGMPVVAVSAFTVNSQTLICSGYGSGNVYEVAAPSNSYTGCSLSMGTANGHALGSRITIIFKLAATGGMQVALRAYASSHGFVLSEQLAATYTLANFLPTTANTWTNFDCVYIANGKWLVVSRSTYPA